LADNLATCWLFYFLKEQPSTPSWISYTLIHGNGSRRGYEVCPITLDFLPALIMSKQTNAINSFLVAVTDTWLHLTTKAVNGFHYSPSPGTNFSVSLLDRCLTNNNSYSAQSDFYFERAQDDDTAACTLNPAATRTFLLPDAISGVEVMNNVSTMLIAKRHVQDGKVYAYLAPADTEENVRQDFSAFTYAMSTDCRSMSSECFDTDEFFGAGTPFNCTKNKYSGDIQQAPFQSQYYANEDLTDSFSITGYDNPFYFIASVFLWLEWPRPAPPDPEIVGQVHGDFAIIVGCSTTVYDVSYQVRNGTVVRFDPQKSNVTVTNALQSPVGFTPGGTTALHQAFSSAGLGTTSAQEMVDNWAVEYSRIAVSLGVAALQGSAATESEYRVPVLMSRIPIAPLVCLLLSNFLYCVVGAVLAVMALIAVRDSETKEVLERATIMGLVAAHFEGDRAQQSVKDMNETYAELSQGNTGRVGISNAPAGGYMYTLS